MEKLFEYFEAKSGLLLSQSEKELISTRFIPKKLRKKHSVLQKGDVCKYLYFIVEGSARMFSTDEKGNEHILHFAIERWWIGDNESYTQNTPSKFTVEMLENTYALAIARDALHELIEKIPAVATTINIIYNQRAISSEKRIHNAISLSPEERFDELGRSYPNFLKKFPLGMIASYLGISAKTLGRIRRNHIRK